MNKSNVSTDELLRMRRAGLRFKDIADRVEMTRQGVAYRLKNFREQDERRAIYPRGKGASTMTRWDWHTRVPEVPPARCLVTGCRRLVGRANRAKGELSILPEPDCCQFCGRPRSPEAIAQAPRDGFVAFMAARSRRAEFGVESFS
ncbi:MAG: hypothetical protein Q8S13_00615 [Dehalococcoidia bacterium]|nr:hypothetical protein [Dehalococcoidia bacterium]